MAWRIDLLLRVISGNHGAGTLCADDGSTTAHRSGRGSMVIEGWRGKNRKGIEDK